MIDPLFRSRFTYRVDFIVTGGSKARCAYLNGECDCQIRVIDSAAAPVAYQITSLESSRRHRV